MLLLLLKLFWVFTRVALFSWGGGPASLGLMQREVVDAGWLTSTEFADGLAVSNALPGPLTPKISAYVGYEVAGLPGAIAAVAGNTLPTTLIMLVVIVYFFQIKDSPSARAILTAVRPVVVGLLAWTAYDVAREMLNASSLGWGAALQQGWDKVLIAGVTLLVLVTTSINPVLVVIAAALFGLLVYR
jgi:chromate transporter